MSRSTVTENTTADVAFANLKLSASSPVTEGMAFVVVEGDDDCRLYRMLLSPDTVVVEKAGSCDNVVEVVRRSLGYTMLRKRVAGIKDADFDNLMGKTYSGGNLFLTDTHDVETMLLSCQEVSRRLCLVNADREITDLLSDVMRILLPLSYLKYYNVKVLFPKNDTEGINFRALKLFSDYERRKSLTQEQWYDEVKGSGGNDMRETFPSYHDYCRFVDENETSDLHNLTNGHDALALIKARIDVINGPKGKKLDVDDLFRQMCMAYSREDFARTRLYALMSDWAKVNKLVI